MSVGKGDNGSDGGGSDDYDDEEEDEEEYANANANANASNNNGSSSNTSNLRDRAASGFPLGKEGAMSRIPQQQQQQQKQQQQQQQQQHLGVSRQQQQKKQQQQPMSFHQGSRIGAVQDKLPKEAGSSLYFFNVAAAHGDSSAKVAASGNVQHRDPEPAMSNYYTSLLTSFPGATASFRNYEAGHEPERRNSNFQTAEQSLRQILSDPISGELMDDAIIFPCGHSFGPAGVQRIQETHACFICQAPTRVDTGSTNFALRLAVQAFRNDRGIPKPGSVRPPKRRRDQDGGETFDGIRHKGVQFPYVVSDRVLIKGNKRTPERFVGKEAIITTQCLNGWYLVRTIDNGESVRLQYRSLQKIEGDGTNWHQEQAGVDLSAQNS